MALDKLEILLIFVAVLIVFQIVRYIAKTKPNKLNGKMVLQRDFAMYFGFGAIVFGVVVYIILKTGGARYYDTVMTFLVLLFSGIFLIIIGSIEKITYDGKTITQKRWFLKERIRTLKDIKRVMRGKFGYVIEFNDGKKMDMDILLTSSVYVVKDIIKKIPKSKVEKDIEFKS